MEMFFVNHKSRDLKFEITNIVFVESCGGVSARLRCPYQLPFPLHPLCVQQLDSVVATNSVSSRTKLNFFILPCLSYITSIKIIIFIS